MGSQFSTGEFRHHPNNYYQNHLIKTTSTRTTKMSKFARMITTNLKQKQLMAKTIHNPMTNSLRKLITPSDSTLNVAELKLFTDLLEDAQRRACAAGQSREFLSSIVPPSQGSLPPRTMEDSLMHALIPMGSSTEVRMKYTSHIGGVRLCRLIQDMDHFAAVVVYKHILNPLQDPDGLSAHTVVTARMDHLFIREDIKNDADIILVGHVTWVGSSSAEVGVRMEQMEDGVRKQVCEARFVMVARDAATGTKSAPINPLELKTKEEKNLFKLGINNIALRAKANQDSLFHEPPTKEENDLIHRMFLSTVNHKARSFAARVLPENSAWMTDHKLKSVMLCEPEHKNDYNKIFGGLIVEKCLDLAFINTWTYTGAAQVPVCTHIDDVIFLKAVEIGDLLYFHSQVVFTHENFVQTRISAEVLNRETKELKLTNVLQVTFKLPSEVPHVVPRSYHEAMACLTGMRHFRISMEREGVVDRSLAEKDLSEVTKYAPSWTSKEEKAEKNLSKKNNVQELLEEDLFMDAETICKIRIAEGGSCYI